MNSSIAGSKRWTIAVVLLALTVALAWSLRFKFSKSAGFFDRIEARTVDMRFIQRGPLSREKLQKISERVAIVAMDDIATQHFGQPIPRQTHAQLVDRLKKAGAKAIIFDVIFADPSRQNPQGDQKFAEAIRRAGNVFLPFDHESTEETPKALLEKISHKLAYSIDAPATAQSVHIRPPVAPLFDAMKGGGHVGVKPDPDGTFRSSILLMEMGAVYPHAVLDAVARTEWKIESPQISGSLKDGFLEIGNRKIGPLTAHSLQHSPQELGDEGENSSSEKTRTDWAIPLNFLGGHETMQVLTIPYVDALEGKADARLKNRIVIVGETATGTTDLRPGPFDSQNIFLGVETNATLIANLLDNDFLSYPPLSTTLLWTVALGIVAGIAAFRFRPGVSLLIAVGILGGYAYLAMQMFDNSRVVWEITAPVITVALCYTTLTAWRLFNSDSEIRESQRALQETQTLLGQYVNEKLAHQLADDPQLRRDMQIGTRREVTVLFSDVRGFTSWSEGQTPEEVKARLDEYFSLMCEIVADDQEGFIDKFIGDGLMAVWNGMSDQEDHARRAVRAALSMKRGLAILNDGWRRQKQAEFNVGIGIASGLAVFGTFGSPNHKLMPTVLGDTVNLASRFEGLSKETGAVIVVGQNTYEELKGEFEFRTLGEVSVRGKMTAVAIYEVLEAKGT